MCVAVHQVLIHVFDIVSEEIEQDIEVRAAPNMRQNQPGVVPDSVHAAVPVLPHIAGRTGTAACTHACTIWHHALDITHAVIHHQASLAHPVQCFVPDGSSEADRLDVTRRTDCPYFALVLLIFLRHRE